MTEPAAQQKPEIQLDRTKLRVFLATFLRLEKREKIRGVLEHTFEQPLPDLEEVLCQTKVHLMFEGYRIDLTKLKETAHGSFIVSMQFRAAMKWWHPLINQNSRLVRLLKRICQTEIPDLQFETFEHVLPTPNYVLDKRRAETLVYNLDRYTFNPWWEVGTDISPLLIASDYHDGRCFVEFFFDAGAYTCATGETVRREDWEKYFIRDRFPDSNPL